jgi:hypothetical protein
MALSPGEPVLRRCPKCGAGFDCGVHRPVDDPCWCVGLGVELDALARLAADFQGCLCGECLRSAQE